MAEKQKNTERKDMMTELTDTAQNIIQQGNRRHVVARADDGHVILDLPLTYVVGGVVAVAVFLPFWSWIIGAGLVAYGFSKRIKLELVREVSDEEDATIQGR